MKIQIFLKMKYDLANITKMVIFHEVKYVLKGNFYVIERLRFFLLSASRRSYFAFASFQSRLGSAPTTYFYGRVGSLPHKSRKFLVVSGRVGSLFWSCFWSYFGRFIK